MKLSPRFLFFCSIWSLAANSLASDQTIFIEHQISQEIAIDDLSDQAEQNIPQILWQNFSSVTQHFSNLVANIHKKNEQLDVSTEVHSFLQFPDHEVLGSLPAFWIESLLGADGGGEILFEMPSHWHRSSKDHELSTIDWNGLSGAIGFNPKFTTWQAEMDINGLVVDKPDSFTYQFSPSDLSANYGLNPDNAKPMLETVLNLPEMVLDNEADSGMLSVEYFQLSNTLLPEQYLPTALNTTIGKLCYQKALSQSENELFNLFDFAAEFKAHDTDIKLINLPPQTSLIDLLDNDESDFASLVNWMAFRPFEASVKFEQLSLHQAGFKGENSCKPVEKPDKSSVNFNNYQDDALHIEARNFEYNGRSAKQESGLELSNAFFHLGRSAFKAEGFATQFDDLKLAIVSDLEENTTDLAKSSLNINISNFELPNIFADDEKLNTKLAFAINRLDVAALVELQTFIEQLTQNLSDEDDPSIFGFALLSKSMELIPKLIKQSPYIQVQGLEKGNKFSVELGKHNKLSGSISLNIDGEQLPQLPSQTDLISALKGNVDLEFKFTQDKANQLVSQLFEVEPSEAAELIQQWTTIGQVTHEGEYYTVTLDIDLEEGQLKGHNPTSNMIVSVLQLYMNTMLSMPIGE
ncbi:DUF945 family protein [Candidatus Albibeggiatoa sp. nov. BB20]|uniref:DUF945 family protein n=1 Tax=Candidatus Albibeggiatoa sp. nov. BB20 TaxID=3162723 RepID=UPI0033656ABD